MTAEVKTGFAGEVEVIEEVSRNGITITFDCISDELLNETYRITVTHEIGSSVQQPFDSRENAEEAMREACEHAGIERFALPAAPSQADALYANWYHAFANARGTEAQARLQDQMIGDPEVRAHVDAIEALAPPRGWPNQLIRTACAEIRKELGMVETIETQAKLTEVAGFGRF